MIHRTRAGFVLALATLVPVTVGAIVIRDDVPDERYRVPDNFFPPLADLPFEGHGVLIAPRWVVTAGHAVSSQSTPIQTVTIANRKRAVTKVIVYPEFRLPQVPDHGPSAPVVAELTALKDIALIELAQAVDDVRPASLYRGGDERGRTAEIIGKGATGDGLKGEADGPHRTVLRRAFNRIESAEGPWLTYRFDQGNAALPLEGMLGSGDSGGPVLIEERSGWRLAALASWKRWDGDLADFRAGIYGEVSYQVRLSYYRGWIEDVMRKEAGDRLPD
jgi:Trypsin